MAPKTSTVTAHRSQVALSEEWLARLRDVGLIQLGRVAATELRAAGMLRSLDDGMPRHVRSADPVTLGDDCPDLPDALARMARQANALASWRHRDGSRLREEARSEATWAKAGEWTEFYLLRLASGDEVAFSLTREAQPVVTLARLDVAADLLTANATAPSPAPPSPGVDPSADHTISCLWTVVWYPRGRLGPLAQEWFNVSWHVGAPDQFTLIIERANLRPDFENRSPTTAQPVSQALHASMRRALVRLPRGARVLSRPANRSQLAS